MNPNNALRLSAVLSALALALTAGAQELHFVDRSMVDPVRLLPPPAAADSAEARTELDLVTRLSQIRTPREMERVAADAKIGMASFQQVMGPWFTAGDLPLTERFLRKAEKDSHDFVDSAKAAFDRKRPLHESKKLKRTSDGQEEGSYPSGHATRGTLLAMVIAELAPDKRAEIMARGWELGWDRVIAGTHFPSDVFAGRTLGQALAFAMFTNPKFKKELAEAKAEVDAARKKTTKPD